MVGDRRFPVELTVEPVTLPALDAQPWVWAYYNPNEIARVIGSDRADTAAIRDRVIARLPPYMHPSALHLVTDWPLNANGKVDRKALLARLAAPADAGVAP